MLFIIVIMFSSSQINKLFTYVNMHLVSSTYWNEGICTKPGDVKKDTEGQNTMANLGRNMAFMLKKLHPDAPPFDPSAPQAASAAADDDDEEFYDDEDDIEDA